VTTALYEFTFTITITIYHITHNVTKNIGLAINYGVLALFTSDKPITGYNMHEYNDMYLNNSICIILAYA